MPVCALYLSSWKATYSGILPQARLDEVDHQLIAKLWAGIFAELDLPRHSILVAEERDELIGVVHLSPSVDDPNDMEVARLYVLPEHQRRGVGSSLLADAERFGRLSGFRHASLWVVENHHAAQGFYTARGWLPTGESVTRQGGGWSVQELRYRLALPDV